MKKIIDLRYGPHVQTALTVLRLCQPIALAIEVRQPATALKLLESSWDTHRTLDELMHPFGKGAASRKIERATRSARCTRAILKRLLGERRKEVARVTAALEVAERLLDMLQEPVI